MSTKLTDRIRSLDDFRCVRFFNDFSQKLFNATDLSQDDLLLAVPEDIRDSTGLRPALGLPAGARREVLETQDAVVCARSILMALAQHPGFAGALEQALDDYRDDEMFADVILALGLAASMTIVAATTKLRVTYEDGKLSLEGGKEVAPAKMVRGIFEPMCTAVGRFFGVSGDSTST